MFKIIICFESLWSSYDLNQICFIYYSFITYQVSLSILCSKLVDSQFINLKCFEDQQVYSLMYFFTLSAQKCFLLEYILIHFNHFKSFKIQQITLANESKKYHKNTIMFLQIVLNFSSYFCFTELVAFKLCIIYIVLSCPLLPPSERRGAKFSIF